MIDDKENIVKIEVADEAISKLNLDEISQYYLRQLLEEQRKGKDCTELEFKYECLKLAIYTQKHREWILDNQDKVFYVGDGIFFD